MSGTPTPTPNPPAADWRKSVLQSYRNSEVREISKVLAALEGSATVTPVSKMMLAMRFEDQIFKSAKDLADYRKKISKRLKKLQKNYKAAPAKEAASGGSKGGSGKGGGSGTPGGSGGSGKDHKEAEDELKAKLRRDYGEELRYIVKNAGAAMADLKRKLGTEKARQLQQHTDNCRCWARDLRILTEEELDAISVPPPPTTTTTTTTEAAKEKEKVKTEDTATKKNDGDSKQQPPQTQQPSSQDQPPTPKPTETKREKKPSVMITNKAQPMSLYSLQQIEKHLETRVGNIRSYIVKHADPDQFLLETLQTRDVLFSKKPVAGNLLRDVLKGQISSQREMLQKATTKHKNNNNANTNTNTNNNSPNNNNTNNNLPNAEDNDDPLLLLQKALEKAQAGVPPPTRNDSKKLEGSLRHLDKMRAASTAMMTYWTLAGDQRLAIAPRDTLKKIHEVVQDGTDFVLEAVKELEQQKQQIRSTSTTVNATSDATSKTSTKKVSLQDAWSKTIELPSLAAASPINVDDEESSNSNNNNNKRPRTNSYRPYCKTRMLFRPNRKTPQPLLLAIKRKGADLRQANCGNSNAIHLVLEFDEAFAMTIYFAPLTVTIRATAKGKKGNDYGSAGTGSSAHWKPLSHGLTSWGSTLDSSDFLRNKENNASGNQQHQNQNQQQQLSVWGVTAGYESIGRVVEERLRDASTHATAILRRCFKNHVKDKTMDFEVELLEGSALLEFLQVSRATYMPHWEDEDVV